VIAKLFRNWRFRTATPAFAPGETLRAYLTGYDTARGEGTMRIGDTVLTVEGAAAAQVDELVDVRVESFDEVRGTGRAFMLASDQGARQRPT
jgi:hypothetical protein